MVWMPKLLATPDCYLLSHDAVFHTTVSAGRAEECVREMLRWQKR